MLLIHFLQRQSQEVTISTLFLLEQMQRESVEGNRFERIRSSVPLWLQILAVLLMTWMLAQPRWIRKDSVQQVAIVLDSSASMSAFKEETKDQLVAELTSISAAAAHSEFYVIESTLPGSNLYRGNDLEALSAALDTWDPNSGEHDFEDALRVARNLAREEGLVTLVTDHLKINLPFNAKLLAVGESKPNLGFAGLRIDEVDGLPRWTAIIRNYHDEAIERSWFLAAGAQRSVPQKITLGPGEIRSIEGPFPENTDFCTLNLEADAFTPDDVLPMARPKPRTLTLFSAVNAAIAEEAETIASTIQNSRLVDLDPENPADMVLFTYDPLDPGLPEQNAIAFIAHRIKLSKIVEGKILAESHPLMDHLNWDPLIVRSSLQIPRRENDMVLLWQDKTPLIMLRKSGQAQQLLFNFDIKGSNALKLPAFIILVHRFAEEIRKQKPALERRVLETAQPLDLTVPQNVEPAPFRLAFRTWDNRMKFETEIDQDDRARQRAPIYPGYLTVYHGAEKILEASTFFADTREANLRKAMSENELEGIGKALVERHTEVDVNWTLWVLLLAIVLITSWAWIAWRQARVSGAGGEFAPAS